MNTIELLQWAIKEPSRENFHQAFSVGRCELDLSDNELATKLQVQRPTIKRWADGVTAPHESGRAVVLQWMLRELRMKAITKLTQMSQEYGAYDDE